MVQPFVGSLEPVFLGCLVGVDAFVGVQLLLYLDPEAMAVVAFVVDGVRSFSELKNEVFWGFLFLVLF